MAYQFLGGTDNWVGFPPGLIGGFIGAGGFNNTVIDATGEKIAYVGRVWFAERTGTKAIRRVGFRFGTVVKAGGSALTVSLQDVTTATGPPAQPDGTPDETVAIANADAGFASNLWYRTNALSADRTVTYGDLLSLVIEFDGAGRLGADAVNIAYGANGGYFPIQSGVLFTASWANFASRGGNSVLEFDDGTFGTLDWSNPMTGFNVHTYNSGSTPDEHAMAFTVAAEIKIDGIGVVCGPTGTSADLEIVLYAGTSVLQTLAVDAHTVPTSGSGWIRGPIPETTLSPGTTYYISAKPTTANNIQANSIDVSDANHLELWSLGSAATYSTRTNAGAWAAATSTRRLLASLRISSINEASSGGGGIPIIGGNIVRAA